MSWLGVIVLLPFIIVGSIIVVLAWIACVITIIVVIVSIVNYLRKNIHVETIKKRI